ncbi:MAG: hypothetical protein V3V15_02760 [Sphingorhabdus sp.]
MPFYTVFHDLKFFLADEAGLAKDALHIHIGLAVFVLARLLWRWRGGWFFAWLIALTAALGGEWLDMVRERAANAEVSAEAHWHDVWNTMLWPTVLLFIGRWLHPRPNIAVQSEPEQPPEPEPESGDLADQAAHDSGEEPTAV